MKIVFALYRATGAAFPHVLNPVYYACLLTWLPAVCQCLNKHNEIRRRIAFASCEPPLISLLGFECMRILSNC